MIGNTLHSRRRSDKLEELSYEEEWTRLCTLADVGLEKIKQHAIKASFRESRFRGIVWMLLLRVLPIERDQWISNLRSLRQEYRELSQRFNSDPASTESYDHPLSQGQSSIWNQYFHDEEFKAIVRQDVVRTFPNVDFFRDEHIQNIMIRILFFYAKKHSEISYKQGMHEVLAPLIFVLVHDIISLAKVQEESPCMEDIREILNLRFLEADAFSLFSQVMNYMKYSYRASHLSPMFATYFQALEFCAIDNSNSQVFMKEGISSHLNWIKNVLLRRVDRQLYQHVKALDIPFEAFGIRWVRLLFGQEFELPDLLYIWDVIFAEGDEFALVNYMVISMLLSIRDRLLVEDSTICLTLLMKYPRSINVKKLVEHALHLKDPECYPYIDLNEVSSGSSPRKFSSSFLKRFTKGNYKSPMYPDQSSSKVVPTSSKPLKKSYKQNKKSIEWSLTTKDVMDGYMLKDPALAFSQLHEMKSSLAKVCNALEFNYGVLVNTLPAEIPLDAKKALVRVKEVCDDLRTLSSPPTMNIVEIEPAAEAKGDTIKEKTLYSKATEMVEIKDSATKDYPEKVGLTNLLYVNFDSIQDCDLHIATCKALSLPI